MLVQPLDHAHGSQYTTLPVDHHKEVNMLHVYVDNIYTFMVVAESKEPKMIFGNLIS